MVSLQQADLPSPPHAGGLRCMPPFYPTVFLNIPTGIDGADWWHGLFQEKTCWGRRGLVVVLHFLQLTHPGSQNEAHTSCDSLLWSPTSGTASISLHQLGILLASAFDITHLQNSLTGGLEGTLPSSSLEFSVDPLRKQVTSSPNFGGSSKSRSSVAAGTSLDSEFFLEG